MGKTYILNSEYKIVYCDPYVGFKSIVAVQRQVSYMNGTEAINSTTK